MCGYALLVAGLISLVHTSLPARASPSGFASLETRARLVAGTVVDVAWMPLKVSTAVKEMELVLSIDGGRTFPVRVTRDLKARSTGVAWRVPNLPSAEVRLALRADLEGHEQILFLSPEFTILADPTARLDLLVAHEGELWTLEALDGRQVPLLPPDRLGDAHESENVSSGIPAEAPFEDPGSPLLLSPTRPSTVLQVFVSPGSITNDGPSESAARFSLPKRE
jgi:hypothetical protein